MGSSTCRVSDQHHVSEGDAARPRAAVGEETDRAPPAARDPNVPRHVLGGESHERVGSPSHACLANPVGRQPDIDPARVDARGEPSHGCGRCGCPAEGVVPAAHRTRGGHRTSGVRDRSLCPPATIAWHPTASRRRQRPAGLEPIARPSLTTDTLGRLPSLTPTAFAGRSTVAPCDSAQVRSTSCNCGCENSNCRQRIDRDRLPTLRIHTLPVLIEIEHG